MKGSTVLKVYNLESLAMVSQTAAGFSSVGTATWLSRFIIAWDAALAAQTGGDLDCDSSRWFHFGPLSSHVISCGFALVSTFFDNPMETKFTHGILDTMSDSFMQARSRMQCLFASVFSVIFLVLFLGSLCLLHALALSLTGAQRTDISFASKKKSTFSLLRQS